MRRSILIALFVGLFAAPAAPSEDFLLTDARRIVFLGDSNTFAGHFIAYVDAYLVTRFPGKEYELINLGLPSETVSGLSEPDHPYPRPDVHTRLIAALDKSKPDLVVVCYGMNDGIYSPRTNERQQKYEDGIRKLVAEAEKRKARVVLMTPDPFDPLPVKKKLLPASAPKFSWLAPYEEYDSVLGAYSDWLLTLRKEKYPVADPHTAINAFVRFMREKQPAYTVSGDGIHPNPTGHAIVAAELLEALHAPSVVDEATITLADKSGKASRGRIENLKIDGNLIELEWETPLPWPHDLKWAPEVIEFAKLTRRLNRHTLAIADADAKYSIHVGKGHLATVTAEDLRKGVDLTAYPKLETNRRAAEALALIQRRQQILGLAWLTDVGHQRPDTPKGIPLKEAQDQAAGLEKKIRELCKPVTLKLTLLRE